MFQATQLIGFGVGSSGPGSISLFASATAMDSSTVTMPANIQAGDLIVFFDRSDTDGGAPASVTPSGFTLLGSSQLSADGFARQNVSYKKAAGTEGGTSVTGMTVGDTSSKLVYVFRATPAAATVTPSTPNAQITDGNPSAQNVAASGGVAPLVVIGCYAANGVVNPRTFSTTKDGEINVATSAYLAYKIYNSAPADSSIDMDDEGISNGLQSFYIQMA